MDNAEGELSPHGTGRKMMRRLHAARSTSHVLYKKAARWMRARAKKIATANMAVILAIAMVVGLRPVGVAAAGAG